MQSGSGNAARPSKRTRTLVLCLVAFFSMGAATAASAFAEGPEYGRCLKAATKSLSNYDSANCTKVATELAKGNYVWTNTIVKKGFTAVLKPSTIATLESKSGTKVTCTGLSVTGEYTGLKTVSTTKTDFTGCESSSLKCNTLSDGTGIVKVKELEGELGIILKGDPRVTDKIGNVLWPKGGTPTSGAEFVEFACAGLVVKVKNSVISPVTSNAMKLTATVKFTAVKGVQKPTKFEGGANMFLEGKFAAGPYEQSGQSATTIQTNEEKIEIRTGLTESTKTTPCDEEAQAELPPGAESEGTEDVDEEEGPLSTLFPTVDTSVDTWYSKEPCAPAQGGEVPPEAEEGREEGEETAAGESERRASARSRRHAAKARR